jgi:hypothetical protein
MERGVDMKLITLAKYSSSYFIYCKGDNFQVPQYQGDTYLVTWHMDT